jgi:hypothetical protein
MMIGENTNIGILKSTCLEPIERIEPFEQNAPTLNH